LASDRVTWSELGRRRRQARLWRAYGTAPVYVPDGGRYILPILETGGPAQFVAELERLSKVGSPWASSVLGFLSLLPDSNGHRDPVRTLDLCRKHADAGDAYALFVCAWALLYRGDHERAVSMMKSAAKSGFPPAAMDLSTFAWNNARTSPSVALKLLRFAERAGHRGAAVWRCVFYKSGRMGFSRQLIGYMFSPLARLRYALSLWSDPYSSKVFMFPTWANGPLFRVTPRRWSAIRIPGSFAC
jgi:hypothetical protein